MKIVQTFWNHPSNVPNKNNRNGGWNLRKHYYLSIAFSVLQLKAQYEEIELVTDCFGRDLLIDCLKLPYTSVIVGLDRLNRFHPDLFALGKIYAYQIQTKPFLHIDNDVFIWKRFDKIVEDSPVVVQSNEIESVFFKELALTLLKEHSYFPKKFLSVIKDTGYLPNYNAGVIGGTNIDFFKEYTKQIFFFVEKFSHLFSPSIRPSMNVVYEQFFLHCLVRELKIDITTLFETSYLSQIYRQNDFLKMVREKSYLHVHFKKSDQQVSQSLERWMMIHHPSCYFRIEWLMNTHKI